MARRIPDLEDEVEVLRLRLAEAEQTLDAIRAGEVDALVVEGPEGPRVYTLEGASNSYRVLIESMSEGAAVLTASGVVLYSNGRLAKMLRQPLQRVIGSTLHDHLPARFWAAADALLELHEAHETTTELRMLDATGEEVPTYLSASTLESDGRRIVCLVAVDLRPQRRTEEALRVSEARFEGIVESAADAIILLDRTQRIMLFNESAERIFGYSRDEVLGAPLDILLPERFRTVHQRRVADFGTQQQRARGMHERRAGIFGLRKNGEEFPAAASISKLDTGPEKIFTVILRDITVEKRIEAEQRFLADAGQELATSLDYEETLSRIASLAVRDLADLCIVEVVEGDEVRRLEVTCRDPSKRWIAELLGRRPFDRSKPSLTRAVLETRQPVLVQTLSTETLESYAQSAEHLRALRAAELRSMVAVPLIARARLLGAITFLSSSASRLYSPADVHFAEEIARRAALAIENSALYRAARQATQARDDVLGVVAHDLRNPLNVILMQASLLRLASPVAHDPSLEPAEVIERAAKRMNRLIEDLLDVVRTEAGQLSIDAAPVPARQLLIDCADAQRPVAASRSLELHCDLAPDLAEVWADRDRLWQLLENLVGNAIKFTNAGGRITLGAKRADGEVLFRVSDTGDGVPADQLPHLFDRFWQARKARRQGAGLGLSIAKAIVEAHGGRIWVESAPGQGTTFYFTIPLAPAERLTTDSR